MKKFYTAKTDRVFKAIFCSDENKHMMIQLLSSMLEKNITELTFLNNELSVDNVLERQKIVDVLAKVDGEYVHIELNSNAVNYLHFRKFIYFSEIYSKKTKRGEKYNFKTKFIHIDLTYGLSDEEDVIKYYVMSTHGKKYINNIEIIEFNMDSLKKYCYTKTKEKYEKFKHLIMLDLNKEDLENLVLGDEFMKEYKERLEKLNEDETFTSAISYEEDQRYILNTEKWISFEEGMEKGIQEKTIEFIRNMHRQNIPLEQIASIAKLPLNEVKTILKI